LISVADETGRIIPPPSRAMSRQSVRSASNLMMSPYDHYAVRKPKNNIILVYCAVKLVM